MTPDPLLEAIKADLDDDAPRLVWADREGGLEGELVIVQCKLAQRDLPRQERWRLTQIERELLERRQKVEQLVTGNTSTVWNRGFACAIDLEQSELLERSARVAARYPLITEISTFLQAFGEDCSPEDSWKTLEEPLASALAHFPLLRSFIGHAVAHDTRYVDPPVMDFPEPNRCSDGLLEVLARAAPNLVNIHIDDGFPSLFGFEILERFAKLESLYLRGAGDLELEDVPGLLRRLPTITRLGLRAEGELTAALVRAPEWRRLTHLSLYETLDRDSIIELAGLTNLTTLAIRTREALPVTELASHENYEQLELDAPITNQDIAILARAPFAKRLRMLVLRGDRLTNDAIADLLSFPNLEQFYFLSSDIDPLDSLRAVIPDVQNA